MGILINILIITPIKHIDGLYEKISGLGSVTYLPDPTLDEVLEFVDGVDVIFTNPNKSKVFLGSDVFNRGKDIKVVCTASTGTVHIDKELANNRNIKIISITKELETINKISSTAELAFTLMMTSIRNVTPAIDSVRNGDWDYERFIGRQVNQLNIGVIGYGRLGKMFVHYCRSFGAKVKVYDPYKSINEEGVQQVHELSEVFLESNVIALHVHVTPETHGMISKDALCFANSDITIINTSRGEVVNEEDIVEFLANNPKSRYATDVLASEFNSKQENPIIKFSKSDAGFYQTIIVPHIGGMTSDAQMLAYHRAADMLDSYLEEMV